MPRPTKPAPPPLQVDTIRVVLAVTALWGIALVVLLVLGDRVDQVWTWTCVAAIGLAALGFAVMRLQGQFGRRGEVEPDPDDASRRPPQSSRTSNSDVS